MKTRIAFALAAALATGACGSDTAQEQVADIEAVAEARAAETPADSAALEARYDRVDSMLDDKSFAECLASVDRPQRAKPTIEEHNRFLDAVAAECGA